MNALVVEDPRGAHATSGARETDGLDYSLDIFVALVKITHEIPAPWSDLRDQLRRAATSITLNIAEGAGEYSPKEKARYYRTARRSASECMAILDLAQRIWEPRPHVAEPKLALVRLSGMLTNMVKSVEARAESE